MYAVEHLDRFSPIPLYHQLKKHLVELIEEGQFGANQALPTEAQLMEQCGVSRVTVRRALHELEHEGYITRVAGKGTFVLQSRLRRELSRLTSFSEEMRESGRKLQTTILDFKKIRAVSQVAEKLLVEPGTQVTYIERIRVVEDVPVSISISFLKPPAGVEITEDELDQVGSLWALLENKGVTIYGADKTMEAIAADQRQAELLLVPLNSPLLLVEGVVYSDLDTPVEYHRVVSHTGLYKYSISLAR